MPTAHFFLWSVSQPMGLAILMSCRRESLCPHLEAGGLTVLWQPRWRGHTCPCYWELPALGIPGAGGMWVGVGGDLPLLPPTHLGGHPGEI